MLRPEEKSGLIIRSIDGKTDIYLNGVCINDKCLSCEVKIEGPYRPKATISLLCERVEGDAIYFIFSRQQNNSCDSNRKSRFIFNMDKAKRNFVIRFTFCNSDSYIFSLR